jgi:adhesin transport system outer membrane protein
MDFTSHLRKTTIQRLPLLAICLALTACGNSNPVEGTVFPLSSDAQVETSPVIVGLQHRKSALPEGSPAQRIATATLSASTAPGAAELRLAKINADIEAKNWLPTFGPNISLSSLESVASSLLVDAVLFDNGYKRAQREYAVTDVEVAAVNLAIEANDRILEALSALVDLEEAEEEAEISARALKVLDGYAAKSGQRVAQGYSALAEQSEIEQSLSEVRLIHDEARQEALNARRSLTLLGVDDIPSTSSSRLPAPSTASYTPLSVALASAKANRTVAQAKMDRASTFPVFGSTSDISSSGSSTVFVVSGSGMGVTTAAASGPFDASKEAAGQSVIHARSEASRLIDSLESGIKSLETRRSGYMTRLKDSNSRFNLYLDQFTAGSQDLTDLVDAYMAKVTLELEAARVGHDITRARYELLHAYGALFDGSRV